MLNLEAKRYRHVGTNSGFPSKRNSSAGTDILGRAWSRSGQPGGQQIQQERTPGACTQPAEDTHGKIKEGGGGSNGASSSSESEKILQTKSHV